MIGRALASLVVGAVLAASAAEEPSSPVEGAALAALAEGAPALVRLADRLWAMPETAHGKFRTADALAATLAAAGFTVERGLADLPTAFVAERGRGRPVVGIVALLDALPGLGQEAFATERRPPAPGAPGHGCGHHLIGAADAGAAIALATGLERTGTAGTIRFVGAPAEEIYHGGVFLVRAGVFDDLDALFFWHPFSVTAVLTRSGLAMESVRFVFHGRPSDATDAAALGRNALVAVERLVAAERAAAGSWPAGAVVNHVVLPVDAIPSVVPERAGVWYFLHGRDLDAVAAIRERLAAMGRRAAAATGTRLEVLTLSRTRRWLVNRTLAGVVARALAAEPPRPTTEEDDELARRLRDSLGLAPGPPWSSETVDLGFGDEPVPVSDDTAEASWVVPRAGFLVAAFPAGTPSHSWQWTAAGRSAAAHEAALRAARVLVRAASALFADATLVEAARAELEEARGRRPYRSPLPPGLGPFDVLEPPRPPSEESSPRQ